MNRLEKLYELFDKVIADMDDALIRRNLTIHSYNVAQISVMIAMKRGLDIELATFAGILHDITLFGDKPEIHAETGAEMARTLLQEWALTTPEETDIICTAISRHGQKALVHGEYDELLKDADVIHIITYNPLEPISEWPGNKSRYESLLEEFNIK